MKKLYKTNSNRLICGVCSGLARYFGIDVTIIRLLFVFLTLVGGSGVLLYFAAAVLMPKEDDIEAEKDAAGSDPFQKED